MRGMTGFSRVVANDNQDLVVELRSFNHRFFELKTNLPHFLGDIEIKARELLRKEVQRGSIYLSINYEDKEIKIDRELIMDYVKKIRSLKDSLNLDGEIDVSFLTQLPGAVSLGNNAGEKIKWHSLKKMIEEALRRLVVEREKEGGLIQRDITYRLAIINRHREKIKKRLPMRTKKYRERLIKKIKGLAKDEERLQLEVSLFTDRSDISEEMTRFSGFLRELCRLVESSEPVGRKLEFVLQEMGREVNTITAKANDLSISKAVISIKNELEKIREQVLNVE
jgi:uncharacterized protein (TIGR00255 family)